jgi:hypothetical protein
MIDPQSPLAQLVRFAGRETTLTGNYEGDVDSWIERQKHNLEKGRRAIVGEIAGEHGQGRHRDLRAWDGLRQAGLGVLPSCGIPGLTGVLLPAGRPRRSSAGQCGRGAAAGMPALRLLATKSKSLDLLYLLP